MTTTVMRVNGYVYATLAGLGELLGPGVVTPDMLRDWVRRDLLATSEPHAPGLVRQGRCNWYRLDIVAEAEWTTRHRGKPRTERRGPHAA
jgi:hypothetical protein